ncbi:MAG: hypothetical protein ABIS27_02140 [Longimicrobiales bacterium]
MQRRAFEPALIAAVLAFTGAMGQAQAVAQVSPPPPRANVTDELAVIRATEALEARGDIAGAEKLARDMLATNPQSLSSLIVLERLLTMQGKVAQIEPFVDRLLAADPLSVIGHQLQVRMYATINRPADLERAATSWIASAPDVETPYREVSRVYRSRGDLDNAARILDQGRRRIGDDALALELGDVYAELKNYDRAVLEWGRGIGKDGQGFLAVQRRLQALPDGGVTTLPQLVAGLRREPTTRERRRAASSIAVDAGLATEADQLARQVYKDLPAGERAQYLVDIGKRADATGLNALAYWAFGEAIRIDTDAARTLAVRTRYAQLALAAGDTTKAAKVYLDLERAAVPGSPQRRQALAARIQLSASRGDIDHALRDLALLRTEFSRAPELDEAAAGVGTALLDRGRLDDAMTAVVGIKGARSGATRGRIYLRRGDVEKARDELMGAAPLLNGAEATSALTLATLIARMSQAGGELLGRALSVASDDAAAAVKLLLEDSSALPPNERAALLDFAALLADRGDRMLLAEAARREIIEKYPQSSVTPAALLALSQSIANRGGPIKDAQALLEKLILEYPRSALVPQARRDLDRLLGRVPGR